MPVSIDIHRTVVTRTALPAAYAYLADFTNTNHWDPGTVRTTLIDGDGGVGSHYANVSRFAGRTVELTYVVEEREPGRRIVLRGRNGTVVALDTMTFTPTPTGGTRVGYHATFSFSGPIALVMPLFGPAFRRLGDRAERRMGEELDALNA